MKILLMLIGLSSFAFGQTTTKRNAMNIAKTDSIVEIKKIKSIELIIDSTTNELCWVVIEKINVKKEWRKIHRQKNLSGNYFVIVSKIKINATTGIIYSRERIELGREHYNPSF
jgi:hypothetical protein